MQPRYQLWNSTCFVCPTFSVVVGYCKLRTHPASPCHKLPLCVKPWVSSSSIPICPQSHNTLRWPQDMDITSLWDLPWHAFDFSLCWCHLDFLAACETCPFSTYLSALWQKLPMALWLILSLIPFLSLTQCHFSEGLSLTTQSPEVPSSFYFDHCSVLDSPSLTTPSSVHLSVAGFSTII